MCVLCTLTDWRGALNTLNRQYSIAIIWTVLNMARCDTKELYRRLQDEECVCYMIEEGRQMLRQFSSFALWVEGVSKDVNTDPPKWTPKKQRKVHVATEDEINRSEVDQDKLEVTSSHNMDTSHSNTRCFQDMQEGGKAVDETARPSSQNYVPDASPCIRSRHTLSEELVGNSPIAWQRQQVSSSFSSSRDRILLCLTVGKELFEADASCEGVFTLQQEMTSRGLLDDLGLLMKSDDRLVAFMACKMMTAVLLSSKKVTPVLKGHLLQCLATINACNQSICLVKQANPDDSNKINTYGQTQEVNQGQVEPGQDNPGQVNPFQVDPGQMNNPTHSDPLLSQGLDTPDQVKSSQVEPDQDLNPIQVNPGQINHAVFTFDLLRLLLIKRSCRDSPHWKVSPHSQRCKRREIPLTGLKFGNEQGFQAEVLHLLYELLPDIALSFIPAATARDLRLSTVGYSYKKTTLLILASFLDLTHALFKGGPVVPQWYSFTFKILPLLMDLLKKYYIDLIILKKLLDILTVSMNQSAEGKPQWIQSQPGVNHLDKPPGEILLTIATSFVDMIVKDSIIDDIPYKSGPVGFGGGEFYSSSGDVVEITERGDRKLLRKLCRVTLSSLKILVAYKCQHSEMILNEADFSKCFQTLSMYICGKLNLPLISKPPIWIFKLFADQDDCLIWVMLCVLNIHRSLYILEPLYSFLKDQLNPHKIFVGFLETVAYDPSVLLDLLISSETPFLEYLVQYLHTVIRDWEAFCHSHQEIGSVGLVLHSEQVTSDEKDDEASDDESVKSVCTSQVSEGNDNSGDESCIHTQRKSSPKPKRRKTEIQRTVADVDPCPQNTVIKAQTMADQSSDNSSSSPTNTNMSQPNDSQDQLEEGISLNVSNHGIKVFNQDLKGASSQSLEDVMTTLIRLRFLIERISGRDLFPYPIAPLLRLLGRVEDMYDNMG